MGLFVLNNEKETTVEGLIKSALANLDLYSDFCGHERFKDDIGQTPPDYLVTTFAMSQLKEALQLILDSGQITQLPNNKAF